MLHFLSEFPLSQESRQMIQACLAPNSPCCFMELFEGSARKITPAKRERLIKENPVNLSTFCTEGDICILLGAMPLKAVYPKKHQKITSIRGEIIEEAGYKVLITLNTEQLAYSSHLLRLFQSDLHSIRTAEKELDISYITYSDEALLLWLTALPTGTAVAFDIETNKTTKGYYAKWYEPEFRITSLSLSVSTQFGVVISQQQLYEPTVLAALKDFFKKPMTFIGHNGIYDTLGLYALGIEVTLSEDTMLQSFALDEQKGGHSLKDLATRYLGMKHYKYLAKEDLALYNAIDTAVTLALEPIQRQALIEDNTVAAYTTLMDLNELVTAMSKHGMKIDRDYYQCLAQEYTSILEDITAQLRAAVIRFKHTNISSFTEVPESLQTQCKTLEAYHKAIASTIYAFNPNYALHLQILLYDLLQLQPQRETSYKSKERSTDDEALGVLEHPIVNLIQKYRSYNTPLKTFILKFLKLSEFDGYIHTSYKLGGTETGRLSAEDSLHSIPAGKNDQGKAIRKGFICEEDEVIISSDYSQAELRIFAVEAHVPFLLDAYRCGRDVHAETMYALGEAWKLLHLDLNDPKDKKTARTLAKNINFGNIYLGGPSALSAVTNISVDILKPILKRYHEVMPEIKEYALNQYKKARKDRFVQSRMGRKRRFYLQPTRHKDPIDDEMRKASVNAPIQGAASDITALAALEIQRRGGTIIHLMHDGIYQVCKKEDALAQAKLTHQIMLEKASQWYPEVPWEAEIEVGTNLAELVKVDV